MLLVTKQKNRGHQWPKEENKSIPSNQTEVKDQIETLRNQLRGLNLAESLSFLAERFPGTAAFSSSFGQEDQVLAHVIFSGNIPIRVFTLDTGRLFQETYDLIDRTRKRYKANIETYFPDTQAVQQLITEKGTNSFYHSVANRKQCCDIRKIEPLKRALQHTEVWITGLRSGQSANREQLDLLTYDDHFEVLKFNPLLHWSLDEITAFLEDHQVPQNPSPLVLFRMSTAERPRGQVQ